MDCILEEGAEKVKCTCCRQFKPISEFPWFHSKMPSWRQQVCKQCIPHLKGERSVVGPFQNCGLVFFAPKPSKT